MKKAGNMSGARSLRTEIMKAMPKGKKIAVKKGKAKSKGAGKLG